MSGDDLNGKLLSFAASHGRTSGDDGQSDRPYWKEGRVAVVKR